MKKLFKEIMDFFSNLFHRVEKELTTVVIPVAFSVSTVLKTVTDFDKTDVIGLLVGNIGKDIEDQLRKYLPLIIQDLDIMNLQLQTDDLNSLLLGVLKVVNNSTDRQKDVFYYNLETMLIQDLSDGKLSFSEAWQLAVYWRENVIKS